MLDLNLNLVRLKFSSQYKWIHKTEGLLLIKLTSKTTGVLRKYAKPLAARESGRGDLSIALTLPRHFLLNLSFGTVYRFSYQTTIIWVIISEFPVGKFSYSDLDDYCGKIQIRDHKISTDSGPITLVQCLSKLWTLSTVLRSPFSTDFILIWYKRSFL